MSRGRRIAGAPGPIRTRGAAALAPDQRRLIMELLLLQAVVAVASTWIGAKFAGADQANWGNALLAGLGTTATHWLAGSLAEGAQGGGGLIHLAPMAINFFIVQWVYAASFGDTILIILMTWVGRFIVGLVAQAVLHEVSGASLAGPLLRVGAGTVDPRDFTAHRAQVGAELAAVMDRVLGA